MVRDHSKRVDSINLIADKVFTKASIPSKSPAIEEMRKMIKQSLDYDQQPLMCQTPSPIHKQYLDDLFATNDTEIETASDIKETKRVLFLKDTKEEPKGVDGQIECDVFDPEDNVFNSLSDTAPNKYQ